MARIECSYYVQDTGRAVFAVWSGQRAYVGLIQALCFNGMLLQLIVRL